MSLLDRIVEGFVDGILPGYICPILRDCAGDDCSNLRMAIVMNESLLDAYKSGAEDAGLWDYETVKSTAQRFPIAKKFISVEKVLMWLRKEGHEDIVQTVATTPGGMVWLTKQVEDFKTDLFGDGYDG